MAEQMRPGGRRRSVARLGVPGLIVAVLTLVALWRVGPPPADEHRAAGTAGRETTILTPLTTLADVLASNSMGRRASLENVPVRRLTSDSTFWAGELDATPVFVVVEQNARREARTFAPGTRLTLVGTVEPALEPEQAIRAWHVDTSTARAVKGAGVYLRANEVSPAGAKR